MQHCTAMCADNMEAARSFVQTIDWNTSGFGLVLIRAAWGVNWHYIRMVVCRQGGWHLNTHPMTTYPASPLCVGGGIVQCLSERVWCCTPIPLWGAAICTCSRASTSAFWMDLMQSWQIDWRLGSKVHERYCTFTHICRTSQGSSCTCINLGIWSGNIQLMVVDGLSITRA